MYQEGKNQTISRKNDEGKAFLFFLMLQNQLLPTYMKGRSEVRQQGLTKPQENWQAR